MAFNEQTNTIDELMIEQTRIRLPGASSIDVWVIADVYRFRRTDGTFTYYAGIDDLEHQVVPRNKHGVSVGEIAKAAYWQALRP